MVYNTMLPPDDPDIYLVNHIIICSYFSNFNLFFQYLLIRILSSVSVPGLEKKIDFINYVCTTHLHRVLHWMLSLLILGLFS